MYNLYIHEKKILENSKKQSEELFKEELNKRRKKELNKLSKNYENRMKDFIFSMCEKPIILRNNNPQENKNKSFSEKNFKFGEFKTDKQRLQLMETYKEKLKEYEQKRKNIEKKRNIIKIKNHRNFILIQPQMRFNSRNKLEKIIEKIKRDDIVNIDMLNMSLWENIKKSKFNSVTKTKEFYNLIDKEDLKDNDIKRIIDQLNDVEESETHNQFKLKNYIEWKYNQNITNSDNKSKKEDNNKQTQYSKDVLQIFGKYDNKKKTQNEYEILVKDDFKTHFKGASQFIELMDIKERNNKNILFKNYSLSNKRTISSLRPKNINIKNWKSIDPPEKKYKSSRNDKFVKMKRPSSVIEFDLDKGKKYDALFNKHNILKNLSEEYGKKKLEMINSMNKEISQSLAKDFMQKYNSINLFDNSNKLNNQNHPIIQNIQNLPETKKDENLKQKIEILSEEISRERRKINNEKYKLFVKRFTKSIFRIKKKEIQKTITNQVKTGNQSDYVILDGTIYPKKNIKKISDIIFRKCNYYNNKKN